MGTSNTDIYGQNVCIKRAADPARSQCSVLTKWEGGRHMSGDVYFTPPPHGLCIHSSALKKNSYEF
jgi:hypothetical protein